MENNKSEIISYTVITIVTLLIIGSFVYFNRVSVVGGNGTGATSTVAVENKPLETFAKCVADTGITMYGAVWCSHCQKEKAAFAQYFKLINYVECPDNIQLCIDKGIKGYPTWIDGAGKLFEGEQGLAGLAKITGCDLPK